MKSLALKAKLAIVIVGMVVITAFLGGTVFYSLGKGNDDAEIVNAAGRQRMLSQAMSKSVLGYSLAKNSLQATRARVSELSRYITGMRAVYTAKVIRPAKQAGMVISDHTTTESNPAIPFPATFTRLVGEAFKAGGDFEVDFIAEDPINSKQGLKDEIDKEALNTLTANPGQVFFRPVELGGKLFLRYYTADIATSPGCVSCHAKYKDGFALKLGEVFGVRRFSVLFASDAEFGRTLIDPSLTEYETALEVFSKTLAAFKSGGEYPADLEMSTFKYYAGSDDPAIQANISEVETTLAAFTGAVDQLTSSELGSDQYWVAQSQVGTLANDLRNLSEQLTGQLTAVARRHQENVRMAVGIMVLAAILAFCGLYFVLSKSVLGPVADMAQVANRIAQGDLTQRIDTNRGDEIGHLSAALDEMSQNLNGMIAKIAHTSQNLVVSGGNIVQATEQVTEGAAHQFRQTEMVATSANEMQAVSQDISRNTTEAADAAGQASQVALEGGDVVRRSIEGMERVSNSVSESARNVEQLAQHSSQIGHIVSVIDDIANQTNLLALNAAIEAARAGDMGRGFAVVADEVRQLATRTTDATKEIAEMIRNIQSGTETAVNSMQEGRNEVEAGSDLVTKTGQSLQQIVEVVKGLTDRIQHIDTATQEQSQSMNDVTVNIGNVSEIARTAQEQARISTESCSEISSLAEDLQAVVGRFKL